MFVTEILIHTPPFSSFLISIGKNLVPGITASDEAMMVPDYAMIGDVFRWIWKGMVCGPVVLSPLQQRKGPQFSCNFHPWFP